MAETAFSKRGDTKSATNIMVTGILFQLASSFFGAPVPYVRKAPVNLICCDNALGHVHELLQGWRGYLITNERFAIALEGTMMLIAVAIFNLNTPGLLLAKGKATAQMQEPQEVSLTDVNGDGKSNRRERSRGESFDE
ncbi:MAG: hypothetical protein M1830_008603 [Pleopsidium flavum]|nr:MAG: hypothetical protein M1830_008603 [Pleopsidium flavum]